jgi:death-on-curing family protein
MARTGTTPAELARRLSVEVDDVLLMLWDAGIEYPRSPQSPIRAQDLRGAERACGLADPRERLTVAYWEYHLRKSPEELRAYAAGLGVRLGPHARRLPKGALAKLDRATRRHAPALTIKNTVTTKPPKRFVWHERGSRREDVTYLTAGEIEEIHMSIAADFATSPDPISPAGVRDQALLESASARPATGLGEVRKYPTVQMAAAALMHSVVHNHAFYNGNKRTGLVSMLSFLDANGFVLTTTQDELFKWTIRVASHRLNPENYIGDLHDIEVQSMTEWICANSRQIDHTNRVINSGPLQKRLVELGCEVQKNGTKLRVRRTVDSGQRLWGKQKTVTLNYSVPYMGEGRQVSKTQLRELRKTLHLAEDDGYDSAAFFGADKTPTDEFISRYRKTLKRLAKV